MSRMVCRDIARPCHVLLCMAALAAILGSAGCWVDRRSDALRCDDQGICPDGRSCEMGWCVVASGPAPVIDAMAIDAIADVCPAGCTTCSAELCIIECDQLGECNQEVACPAGMACEVRCTGAGSCLMGVVCDSAADCTVVCSNTASCAGPVTCGAGACNVDCSGMSSCAGGVECSESCACTTSCSGAGACAEALACPEDCARNGECRNTGAGCNDC